MKFKKYLIFSALGAYSLVFFSTPSFSQSDSKKKHPAIEEYLDADINMIGWVDINKLDIEHTQKVLESMTAGPQPTVEMDMAKTIHRSLQDAKLEKVYILGGMSAILGDTSSIAAVLPCTNPSEIVQKLRGNQVLAKMVFHETPSAVLVAANKQSIDKILKAVDKPSDAMQTAITNAEGIHGIAIAPPPSFFQTVLQMAPKGELSDSIGGIFQSLSDLQWMTLTQKAEKQMPIVDSAFKTADSASKFASMANEMLQATVSSSQPIKLFVAKKKHVGIPEVAIAETLPKLLSKARQSAGDQQSANNMKQIGLAFHNFASVANAFPPQALTNKDGNRLLSWRVLLLPYIDQSDLYNQFHLDEPWDSPHNKDLIDKMPNAYVSPVAGEGKPLEKGHTRYVTPLTENSALGKPGEAIFFQHVLDGTSNTIWLVEAAPEHSVIWTKPDDMEIDSDDPLAKIIMKGSKHFRAGFLDGSVRNISTDIAKEIVNALFSVNGGEVIDTDALQSKP
jgi:Protein of unknown function (DUF1559)